MKNVQKGFTLIELMIVVAIIAILAAIAVPAYQNYIIRSKITEGLSAADMARTAISESFMSTGVVASSNAGAGLPAAASITSKYVTSLTVGANGTITVVVQGTNSDADTKNVVLTPHEGTTANALGTTANYSGPIGWVCTGSVATKYLPASCR
jgi:type IV pilus assembly protein PilA